MSKLRLFLLNSTELKKIQNSPFTNDVYVVIKLQTVVNSNPENVNSVHGTINISPTVKFECLFYIDEGLFIPNSVRCVFSALTINLF